jgi:hypothetical protein
MIPHEFILSPGVWIGEGKITFSASPEYIKFYTKWEIKQEGSILNCIQIVEMQGIDEHVINFLQFSDVTPHSFLVQLENEMMGKVTGTGVIDTTTLAWEFRGQSDFEGFEIYERQENGDYMLHAEYASPDQFRTIVDGLIWKKQPLTKS